MNDYIDFLKEQEFVRNNVIDGLKDYKSQNLATQSKMGEILTAQVTVYKEIIKLMGDEIYELDLENRVLREITGKH
jgi:hypothetical protein